jgi:hypothetical protein
MIRRGPVIDRDLLTAAREECLGTLQNSSEVLGESVIKMIRGDRQKVCQICRKEFIAIRRGVKTYRHRKKEVQQNQ